MKLNLDRYNERVKKAGKEVLADIKLTASSMGIVHRENSPSNGASVPKMNDKYRQNDGAINQIAFKVRRSLIYRHKGAGKGKGGVKGSRWLNKYNVPKSTNINSYGKMGTGGRKEAPFINQVLEGVNGVEKIAFVAAEELGDAIVNKMLVK